VYCDKRTYRKNVTACISSQFIGLFHAALTVTDDGYSDGSSVISIPETYVDDHVCCISWSMLELYLVIMQYFSNLIHNLCQLMGIIGAYWLVHILGSL
jgi:hypothetical protein